MKTYLFSELVEGHNFKHTYNGYTKREAIKLFNKAKREAKKYGSYWIYQEQFKGY